ncbi:MAG: cytochrome [Nevskia sp.]|nr:cytochrome [Nevskia sp.]
MSRSVLISRGFIAGSMLLLAACGSGQDGKAAAPMAAPTPPPVAASPAIQKIYDSTCSNCHGKPASGAPQLGDAKAWAPRAAQGREVVLGHIINGYKGMPPMGMCMQCGEDDFVAVTEYMAGAKLQ